MPPPTPLQAAIRGGVSLEALRDELVRWRDAGVSQAEALASLEALRVECVDEAEEDRVRELMDFVVGFCAPRLRIY